MSNLTLGLDLGSTSIGWALLRSDGPQQGILYAGVRVFPEGVDRDQQGGEKSKAADRRTTRGMRRQVARRARRKRQLRELLIKKNLLPGTADELEDVLALNPYPLRARATKEELSPYEIGRILIHINQRRGFLSNRKTDKAKAKKAKGMLAEISALANAMAGQTLGEYLNQVGSAFDHRRRGPEPTEKKLREGQLRDTVRRLHTRRSMYIDEFEAMWGAQRRYHPDILTDELKLQLYNPEPDENWVCRGIIFGQRKMYWPKSVSAAASLRI